MRGTGCQSQDCKCRTDGIPQLRIDPRFSSLTSFNPALVKQSIPKVNAVAPIHAVDINITCGFKTGTKLVTNAPTVKPPSRPHRPRTFDRRPPWRVARRNQPKAKPPAAATQYLAKVKKKTPMAAPKRDEMTQARRYRPRKVVEGGLGDGGWRFGSTLSTSRVCQSWSMKL